MNFVSVENLAASVDRWCSDNQVAPANGQASEATTVRTVRYYRTLGLVDGPEGGLRGSYGEKHFLQLAAIRLLQAQGLPLRRIQQLLMGRPIDDLRRIRREGLRELGSGAPPVFSPPVGGESWQLTALDDEWLVVSRRGQTPTPEQRLAILDVLGRPQPSLPRTADR